jgi:hypothetical protein
MLVGGSGGGRRRREATGQLLLLLLLLSLTDGYFAVCKQLLADGKGGQGYDVAAEPEVGHEHAAKLLGCHQRLVVRPKKPVRQHAGPQR